MSVKQISSIKKYEGVNRLIQVIFVWLMYGVVLILTQFFDLKQRIQEVNIHFGGSLNLISHQSHLVWIESHLVQTGLNSNYLFHLRLSQTLENFRIPVFPEFSNVQFNLTSSLCLVKHKILQNF